MEARWSRPLTAALVMMLAVLVPQAQAQSFVVGPQATAFKPGIAVDPVTGVGHLAWGEQRPFGEVDLLHYCRLPRGATDCDRRETFTVAPDIEAFDNHQVLIPESGRVLLLARRCCGKGEGVWMLESTDGGGTFGAPVQVSDGFNSLYRATFGPGEFNVSLTSDTDSSGVKYQSAPIDGSAPAKTFATVGDGSGQWYFGSTAFLGALTPMVAFGDLDNIFFRVKDPTLASDPNDLANWKPTQPLGKGDEPLLAGGPRGVYLLYSDDEVNQQYMVRGFDPALEQFGPPVAVSERGDPIFRDFMQDAGGGLNAAWISNGGDDPLRFRTSADGRDWGPVQTLEAATGDNAFNLRIGAAADGGGWVVFDGNSSGPVKVAPIPPRGAGGSGGSGAAGCLGSLALKKGIVAIPRNGACIKKISGTRYGSDGEVRVNGMDLIPAKAGGAAARAAADQPPIELDTSKNTVKTTAAVTVKTGEVVLDKNGVNWDVDADVEFKQVQKFDIKLFGFPITGDADVSFKPGGEVRIKANLGLPSFLAGTTGRVELRASNAKGLIVDGLEIRVPYYEFGVAAIKDLEVTYQKAGNVFEGGAGIVLPPQEDKAISFGFGLADGKFKHAEASAGPPLPPFPLLLVPVPPIFLNQVGIAVDDIGGLTINGGVQLTGGPKVAGKALIAIDALPPKGFKLDFPDDKDWAKFDLSGDVSMAGLALGGGFISFRTDGLFEFGGSLGPLKLPPVVPVVRASAAVNGFMNIGSGDWLIGGKVEVCAPASCKVPISGGESPLKGTADLVGSSVGIIACVDVGVSIGASYRWEQQKFDGYGGGCNVSDFKPSASSARIRAAQAGTINVRGGLPQVNFAFKGADAPPKVVLTEPGGRTISSDPADPNTPVKGDRFAIWTSPEANLTYVAVAAPKAGAWTVNALEGSAAIVETRTADGLPKASVKAAVRGRGHARSVSYDVKRIAGQRVVFLERMGASVGRRIGVVTGGGKGRLRFEPGFGPAGRRQIVALVEQDGKPRETVEVASYTAPRPLLPSRPAKVRLRRLKGGKVRVTWARSRRAKTYDVRVRLSDGRRETFKARRRTLTIRGVDRDVRGTVSVNGQGQRMADGPARVAKLKRARRR